MITRPSGEPLSGDLFTKVGWKPAFGNADLEYRNRIDGMHALRHLFASTLLARGVSVKELAHYNCLDTVLTRGHRGDS
ncbi:hypothetical protein [Nocardia jejuensis]|uniref:hypothetical protein n=1 Tax=Nocardia jejuensis TaxID=328049 RepID=UPI000A7A1360|nr:hypothetical protein [Nocardia jejuensis]